MLLIRIGRDTFKSIQANILDRYGKLLTVGAYIQRPEYPQTASRAPSASARHGSSDPMYPALEELGLLMGSIVNDVIAPKDVHLNTVKTYSNQLKAWHDSLPLSLTLMNSVLSSEYDSSLRTSTLLMHSSYLCSITQLTRRFLIEQVTAQISGALDDPGSYPIGWGSSQEECKQAEVFCTECVEAAVQLASVRSG